MEKKKLPAFMPMVFAVILSAGIFMGSKLDFMSEGKSFFSLPSKNFNKLHELINFIEQEYVDDISKEALIDKAINSLLEELDPHSNYIPPADLSAYNDPLEGNFEGIGIEFFILKDSVTVLNTISGGPSESAGIQAGDRFVKVNGESIVGKELENNSVITRLKGKKGTSVNISLVRRGIDSLMNYTVVRGTIPIKSVEVSYMVDKNIGYMKINRFSKTTYSEFMEHAGKLKDKGMKKMILDLRGNGGGYLNAAIKLADEFLENKELIVYTEGKARPRASYYATKGGEYSGTELAILVDENSASASEILAGAIQDNDKGYVIGRRTFGKGLVQEQVLWPDGSAVRLTIARYYTPAGRSIQKIYENGKKEDYYNETASRYHSGEMLGNDTLQFPDSLRFYTTGGRVVYGGGGIMPDFFVPLDTTEASPYLSELFQLGLINQFAFEYVDKHREKMKQYRSFNDFNRTFTISDHMFSEFIKFNERNGIAGDFKSINKSSRLLRLRLKANIARHMWKGEGFYPIMHEIDNAFQKALTVLREK
jgi:carboxyl-terminal processing protease